jgi:DNA-binding response OmpR family regulator
MSTILIVDDSQSALETLIAALDGQGYQLVTAENGSKGLQLASQIRPDMILLDVMMPGMDGFEVCKRLRAKLSTALIPVIMLTARADLESKELGFLAGTDDYLTKPFDRPELVARVQRLLARTYGWGQQHQGAMASATPPGSDGRFEVGRWSTG